jgi:hypothetical protein
VEIVERKLKNSKVFNTCAACSGVLTVLHAVFYEGRMISLCGSCLSLGDGSVRTDEEILKLIKDRANPEGTSENLTQSVRDWIEKVYGEENG